MTTLNVSLGVFCNHCDFLKKKKGDCWQASMLVTKSIAIFCLNFSESTVKNKLSCLPLNYQNDVDPQIYIFPKQSPFYK